ncbi:response regulator [Paenibacillus lemnae]|uniref:Response regulator n=1 Tax=Paenibacillus lemnae TaxID=1330551 RepID=A0A848MAK4_PAELE|nr:response regulator [Paenibacillus lemnae]NMO97231.1 response regulator [Paenibacillus lemnae]
MRALIVDDESRVRKAIRLLVHWEEHGITEVHEAKNGMEAMELIPQLRPHIVLLDMMMPLKNGMDLMEWMNEHTPSTKFLVISGHDDFDYVRSTLRYNGLDYILKPVDEEQINSAVAKAAGIWHSEEEERQAAQRQNVQVNEYRPAYSERLLSALIEDEHAQAQTMRRLQDDRIIPADITGISLGVLQVDVSDQALFQRFGNQWDLLMFALLNICNEFLQENSRGLAFRYPGVKNHIIFLMWGHPETRISLLEQINQGMENTLGRRMHFGLSSPGHSLDEIPKLYRQVNAVLGTRNLLEMNHYIHSAERPEDTGRFPQLPFSHTEDAWRLAVLSGQETVIREAVQAWTSDIRKSGRISPEMLKQWNRDIERFLTGLPYEISPSAADPLLAEYQQAAAEFTAPDPYRYRLHLQDWQDYWEELLLLMSRTLQSLKPEGGELIQDITSYIDHHYASDVSLYDLSAQFHVSREYVSRKFKQTHGINIPEYINRIRTAKAKVLLRSPDMKISKIAETVGFKNEKYFSLVFKKHEGLSPNDYRKASQSG